MRRYGRSRSAIAGFLTRFGYIYSFIALAASTEYGVPIEIKLWDSQRSPLSHMVDVTNEFGLKVLTEHNFLNDNNIAFSPYGLMGILVALYEGVDGESSYQIQRSMQLPWNRNVMRIGFRDIHRTLKTYFVPEEGFLAGLALNNENVTFNEAYVKILRFYGFDLETEQTSSKPPERDNITTTSISYSETTTTTPVNNINTVPSNENAMPSSTVSTKEETTPSSNVETVDVRGSKEETSTSPMNTLTTVISTLETTTASSAQLASTNQLKEQATVQSSTTLEPQLSTETSTASQITESPSTEAGTISTLPIDIPSTVSQTTTLDTTTRSSNEATAQITMPDNLSSTVSKALTTIDASVESSTTASSTASTLETLQRRKRSILDFIYTSSPYAEEYEAYRSFDIGSALPEPNNDYDKMFSVNGLRNIEVTYMHYDSILDHAFLPHLEASALRLPLDSEKYYLLVVLPMRRGVSELGRLLARMARESDLSDIYTALRPCRVRAAVPSFVVKGHVTLTTDLQKLGMRDVFEPRQHDFTPMTHQPGVYVRSIEQAVSVAIRKYQHSNPPKAYIPNANPVYFAATYPFLYFVMDANIHVALMAGKMVDPLNTRIL